MRGDATNEWLLGVPNSGVIAGGNTFAIDYYDGTTEFPFLQLSNSGALRLPAYGAGFLQTDASGNVTAGPFSGTVPWSSITSTPATLAGYGIVDAQPLDGDLTAIAALTGTGFLQRTGTNTWTLGSVSVTPAGSNTQIQYNDSGALGASSGLSYDNTTRELILTGSLGAAASIRAHVENGNAAGSADFLALNSTGEFAISLITGAAALAFGFIPSDTGLFATNGAAGLWLGTIGVSAPVLFCVNNVEKARVSTAGNLLIGSTSNFGLTTGGVRADAAYFGNYARIGSGFGSGPYFQLDSGDYTLISFARSNAAKFSMGTAGATNDFIAGTVQDDMAFKSDASRAMLFSTDNGGGYALKLGAGTGGAIEFGQLALTTGLSINTATKTFPLTINGTVVNVLCQ
jgi:hypothetical protein